MHWECSVFLFKCRGTIMNYNEFNKCVTARLMRGIRSVSVKNDA